MKIEGIESMIGVKIKTRRELIIVTAYLMSLFFSLPCEAESLTIEAKQIYQDYHPAVMQIRVISRSSGEKSTLGSGFFFTKDGLVASNYHVVSDAVNYPLLYYVEFLMADGQRGSLEILNIDPVHDLAILRAEKKVDKYFRLGSSDLKKGAKIFSFGNPYDLGMIIVEGLFNGLLERAKYRKILFSGNLNPGMSGGPALLEDGNVFGVNVSTAGNDISFFVPVEYLKDLHQEVEENSGGSVGPPWSSVIRKHLVRSQEELFNKLLKKESWEKSIIGVAKVPSEISQEFKCWGRSGDNRRHWIKDEYFSCSTGDRVTLSSTLKTGYIYFDYEWYSSRAKNPLRFYNLYEKYAANRKLTLGIAYERDVGNFTCEQEFVDIDGYQCKVEVCTRHYKEFGGLFDVSFQATTIDMPNEGFVINVILLGVTELQSKNFLRKFLSEIEWQK